MISLLVILGTSAAAALFIVLALGVKLRPEKKVIRSPISKGRHSKRRLRRAPTPKSEDSSGPMGARSEAGNGGPPLEMSGALPTPLEPPATSQQPVTPTGWSTADTASSSQPVRPDETGQPMPTTSDSQTVAPLEKTGASTTARLPGIEESAAEPVTGAEASAAQPAPGSKPWPSALRPFSSPPPPPVPPPVAPVEPPATDAEGDQAAGGAIVATPEPETSILETAKPEVETAKPEVETAKPEVETAKPDAEAGKPAIATAKPEVAESPVSPPITPPAQKGAAPTPSYYDLDFKPPGSEEPAKTPASTDFVSPPVNAASAPPVELETPAVSTPVPDPGETKTEPHRPSVERPTAVSNAYEAAVTIAPLPKERPAPDLLRSDSVETAGRLKWGGWKMRASQGMTVAATKLLLALMLFSVVLSLIAVFAIKTLGAIMRGLVGT